MPAASAAWASGTARGWRARSAKWRKTTELPASLSAIAATAQRGQLKSAYMMVSSGSSARTTEVVVSPNRAGSARW